MPGRIFINYRRGDEPGFALALYTRLEQALSAEQLFMDVEGGISAGHDFVQVLETQIAQCDVLLALIGQNWLSAMDETGARRLDSPEDFVRLEIESAVQLGKRVIPVLINKTEMPLAADLPEPLQALTRRNAVRLTQEQFRTDVQGLVTVLEGALAEAQVARDVATRAAAEAKLRHQKEAAKADEAARSHITPRSGAPTRRLLLQGFELRLGVGIVIRDVRSAVGLGDIEVDEQRGRTALSGSSDSTVKLWDVATGRELRTFKVPDTAFSSVAFSPDGRLTLCAGGETAWLWELATGKQLRAFTGNPWALITVAFSPDGNSALTGGGAPMLWEVTTGRERYVFSGHDDDWVNSVAFAPNGRMALSGSSDKTMKLWDLTGR